MKKLLLAIFALMFFRPVYAQSVLLGVSGGQAYSNLSIGVVTQTELPVRNFELDVRNEFAPYENHQGLGHGTAEAIRGSGIYWRNAIGFTGGYEFSEYTTSIHKAARYASAGFIFRKSLDGVPSRFEFDYVRQVQNRLVGGTESSYLQGGRFGMTTRLGCSGNFCYRLDWEVQAGRVLQQSNPQCDGTFGGPITCARNSAVAGGAKVSFEIEFPRHRGQEYDRF